MKFITIDMKATVDVDPELEEMKHRLRFMESQLEHIKAGDFDGENGNTAAMKKNAIAASSASIKVAKKEIKAHKSEDTMLTVGFIPAAKMSSITPLAMGGDNDIMALTDSAREVCRLGVVGWSNANDNDGKPVKFNAATMLDMLERVGMLHSMAAFVRRYNSLEDETIKK